VFPAALQIFRGDGRDRRAAVGVGALQPRSAWRYNFAGDSPRGSMFINVRCRNHEDGKRFDLTGGVVYNVPLDAGGRRAFRKQKDESLEEFEMYVQKIVSKPKEQESDAASVSSSGSARGKRSSSLRRSSAATFFAAFGT